MANDEVILRFDEVSFEHDHKTPILHEAKFTLRHGQKFALMGQNGGGKSTIFNLITGDLRRDSGSILLFGRDIARLKPHERAHCGLARTYQIITLFPNDTLEHNVVLSLLGRTPARWNAFRQ